jgi:signal transduction histidine kinase/ActR/RegA family two-component response regulator
MRKFLGIREPGLGRRLAALVLLVAASFASAKIGLLVPIVRQRVTLLWPPAGIALAAVLLGGSWVWPGIALASFLVSLSTHTPPLAALVIACGNTAQALAGGWLLRRAGFRNDLERVRDVLLLVVLGAVLPPVLSAVTGIGILHLTGMIPAQRVAPSMFSWWLGDVMGVLLVTPLVLTWLAHPFRKPRRERVLEAFALGLCLLTVGGLTLSSWNTSPILHLPLAFTLFPFLVWGALRFGPRGAASTTCLASGIALWATGQGLAPFALGTVEDQLLYFYSYIVVAMMTSMLLAAVFAERARAEGERALLLAAERMARTEAEKANEAKDRFLATLSHELRTPLTPVLAVLSRLERDGRCEGAAADLAMIRRNVELESRLIDDLLDLTRITRGKLDLHPEVADAGKILDHVIGMCLEPEVAAGHLRLERDLAAADHRVWADPSRLTQVFWNLLNNAVKFTPTGGTIAVRSRRGADSLVLAVEDSGVGIDPEVLPHIFGAFEQGHARSPRGIGGLGLGLSISKAIVEMHGGRLTAASAGQGRGATFTVSLPASLPRGTGEVPVVERPDVHPKPGIQNLRILLVEDHADTAEAMADLLGLLGHDVRVAGGVRAALAAAAEAVHSQGLDLLISDLGLPDGSGLDIMRELAPSGLPGIALSGYGMEDDVRRSLEAGFRRHLTKPVGLQALEAAIRQVLRQEAPSGD